GSVVPEDPFRELTAPFRMADERLAEADTVELHPEVDRERSVADRPGPRIADPDEAVRAVEVERLIHQAGDETGAALEGSVVGALDVGRVSVARPPGDQAGRRRHARGGRRTGVVAGGGEQERAR